MPATIEFGAAVANFPAVKGAPGPGSSLRISGGFIQAKRDDETNWSNLISVATLTGTDGRSVELQVLGTALQARQTGGTWATVFDLNTLKPSDGINGKSAELQVSGSTLQWRQAGGSWATLFDLASLKGAPGPGTEMQVAGGWVQWRPIGAATWTNLITVAALTGGAGLNAELRVVGTALQLRLGTAAWATVFDLASLQGAAGADGKSAELQVSGSTLQWRQAGSSWAALFDLASLKGAPGPGTEMQVAGGWVQWRPIGAATWTNLITVAALTGGAGLNAELRVVGTALQLRLGTAAWATVFDLASLQGAAGADGKSAELQVSGSTLQWRQAGGSWATLFDLASLKGAPGRDGGLYSYDRPGVGPDYFTGDRSVKDPLAYASLDPAATVRTDEGLASRLTGEGWVLSKQRWPVEPDQTYRYRCAWVRSEAPSDPSGDTLRAGVLLFDANDAVVQDRVLHEWSAVTVGQRQTFTAYLSRQDLDIDGVQILPPDARTARPYLRVYGGAQKTDIEVLSWSSGDGGGVGGGAGEAAAYAAAAAGSAADADFDAGRAQAAATSAAQAVPGYDTLARLQADLPSLAVGSVRQVTRDGDRNGVYTVELVGGAKVVTPDTTATVPGLDARTLALEGRSTILEMEGLGAIVREGGAILQFWDMEGRARNAGYLIDFAGYEGRYRPLFLKTSGDPLVSWDRDTDGLLFHPAPGRGLPEMRTEENDKTFIFDWGRGTPMVMWGNRSDGSTSFLPSDMVIANIAGRLPSTAVDQDAVPEGVPFREVYAPTLIGPTTVRYLAQEQGAAGLQSYRSRTDLPSSTIAMREAAGTMHFGIGFSDSIGVGGSQVREDQLVAHDAKWLRDAYMYNVGVRPGVGVYTLDPAAVTDFAPLQEFSYFQDGSPTGYGETPASGCAAMMAYLLDQAGKRRRRFHYVTVGQAGYEIAEISKGTKPWDNFIAAVSCGIRLAKAYACRPEFTIFANIGVNDRSQRTASYIQTRIAALQSDAQAEIQRQMTAAGLVAPAVVRMILNQMAAPSNNQPVFAYPQMEIAVGQEAAAAASGGAILLITGRAFGKGSYGYRDTLHSYMPGYSVDGEFDAKALLWPTLKGSLWTGCRPRTITRNPDSIDVQWYGVGGITIDTDYWPAAQNLGFGLDDLAGNPVAMQAVTQIASDTTRIPSPGLSALGALDLSYAYKNGPGATGRPGTWGNIRDNDTTTSLTVPGLQLFNPAATFLKRI